MNMHWLLLKSYLNPDIENNLQPILVNFNVTSEIFEVRLTLLTTLNSFLFFFFRSHSSNAQRPPVSRFVHPPSVVRFRLILPGPACDNKKGL